MITLTINGVDRAGIVNWQSLSREEVLTREPNSLSFLIKKHNGQTYRPTSGHEVVLTIGGTKEFGGYIVEIEEAVEARVEYLKISCKDYTQTLDRYLVSKSYTSQTVSQIVADLIDTFATDFTYTNTSCDVLVEKIQFNYLPVSQCLQKLTEIASGYDWYADYDKDIHFFSTDAEISSFNLNDTSGNYVYNSLVVREDTHQLRNEIIIRGGLLTSETSRIEYWSGDTTKKIFPLATKFASVPTVTVGGSPITVGVDFLDNPASFTALWNYNEKSLKFASAPASGTNNIVITGYPQYPLILQTRDETSIATYGVYQHVIVDKNIRDLETAQLRARAELIKNGQPLKTANFITYTSGLKTGQTINIQSTIRSIDQDFKVQTIRSVLKTPNTDELTHTVECVTADDIGINDILAKLLIKNPSDQIDISADEVVSRIRQLEENITVTDSVGTPVKTSPPYYVGSTAIMGFFTMG